MALQDGGLERGDAGGPAGPMGKVPRRWRLGDDPRARVAPPPPNRVVPGGQLAVTLVTVAAWPGPGMLTSTTWRLVAVTRAHSARLEVTAPTTSWPPVAPTVVQARGGWPPPADVGKVPSMCRLDRGLAPVCSRVLAPPPTSWVPSGHGAVVATVDPGPAGPGMLDSTTTAGNGPGPRGAGAPGVLAGEAAGARMASVAPAPGRRGPGQAGPAARR